MRRLALLAMLLPGMAAAQTPQTYFSHPAPSTLTGSEIVGPVRQNGADKSLTLSALANFVATSATVPFQAPLGTPASSSAPCTAGQFEDDANYHYVCVATNTWKRVALSPFDAGTAPGIVQFLVAQAASSTSISAEWTAPATGTGPFTYEVDYAPTGSGSWASFTVGLLAPYTTITGLAANTGYDIRVLASTVYGTSTAVVLSDVMTSSGAPSSGALVFNAPTNSGLLAAIAAGL